MRFYFQKTLYLLIVMACFLALCAVSWSFTQDDAFISLRYAKNLVSGHGLRFNVNESIPVEGYTNFLWVILQTTPFLTGSDPVIFSKTLGVLAALCLMVLFRNSALLITGGITLSLLGIFMFSINLPVVLWSVSGMETLFFALCCFAALTIREDRTKTGFPGRILWTSAAFLTRPEGLLLIPAIAIGCFFGENRSLQEALKKAVKYVAGCLILCSIYLIWKYSYFGSIIPNTYYAKVTTSVTDRISDGFYYFSGWLIHWGWPLLVASALAFLDSKHFRIKIQCALFSAIVLLYIIYIGGDFMQYQRFFIPVVSPLMLLSLSGLSQGWRKTGKSPALRAVLFVFILTGLVSYLIPNCYGHYRALINWDSSSWSRESKHHDTIVAAWMKDQCPPETRIAIFNIGRIPYYTGFTTIDTLGLTDKEIAVHLRDWNVCKLGRTVMDKKPDIIIPQVFKIEQVMGQDWMSFFMGDWRGSRYLTDLILILQNNEMLRDQETGCPDLISEMNSLYEKRVIRINPYDVSMYFRKGFESLPD